MLMMIFFSHSQFDEILAMGMNNLLLPVFGVLNSDLDEGLIYIMMFSIRVKRIYTNLYCEVYMMKIRYFIFQVLQTSVFSFI